MRTGQASLVSLAALLAALGDTLRIAIQRAWSDDPEDHVRLVAYDTATGEWGAALFPRARPETGRTGLSKITAHGDEVCIVERDNRIGAAALTKKLYAVPVSELNPAPLGAQLPVVGYREIRDPLVDLAGTGGSVVDRFEGFTIDLSGAAFAVTDNDGVDDSSGETHFLRLGPSDGM